MFLFLIRLDCHLEAIWCLRPDQYRNKHRRQKLALGKKGDWIIRCQKSMNTPDSNAQDQMSKGTIKTHPRNKKRQNNHDTKRVCIPQTQILKTPSVQQQRQKIKCCPWCKRLLNNQTPKQCHATPQSWHSPAVPACQRWAPSLCQSQQRRWVSRSLPPSDCGSRCQWCRPVGTHRHFMWLHASACIFIAHTDIPSGFMLLLVYLLHTDISCGFMLLLVYLLHTHTFHLASCFYLYIYVQNLKWNKAQTNNRVN